MQFLEEELFVMKTNIYNDDYELSMLGFVSSQIKEVHNLVFGTLIYSNRLDHLTSKQLVKIFSCFTNIIW